jgi:hypothetical protein
MIKKIAVILLLLIFVLLSCMQVSAEEIIRYSEEYQATIDKMQEIPNNDTLKEWFNIDLPLDDNQNEIYTVEFDTSKVELNKLGEYDITMTFYKNEANKFTKNFKLKVIDNIVNTDKEKIDIKYIESILKTIAITVLVVLLIMTIFNHTEIEKIAIVQNNKFIKVLTLQNKKDFDSKIAYVLRKLKINDVKNVLLINKNDLNATQLSQIKTDKKYKYALFLN